MDIGTDKVKRKRKRKNQRSDDRFQKRLVVGHNEDGSPILKYFYGRTLSEAEDKRDAFKTKMNAGLDVNGNITVSEWIKTCLKLYRTNVNKLYIERDKVPFRRLDKAIGHMKVSDVRDADLQKALNDVADMSYSTIKAYHHAMTLVFDKARRNKLILDNPAEDLDLPHGEKGSHRALERWESDCILENWNKHRAGLWAMLMLLCGLRRGEMMALTWDCVDIVNRQIKVKQVAVIQSNQAIIEERAKTVAGIRVLPICTPLLEALLAVPEDKRDGFVCLSSKGRQLTESAFSRGWDGFNLAMQRILNGEEVVQQGRREKLESKIKAAKQAGREYTIFKVQAHDLRHTFATSLYDCGVQVKAAQYYLGHADIRMTLGLYTHLSERRENDSRSRLVSFLDGWLSKSETPIVAAVEVVDDAKNQGDGVKMVSDKNED